jgi:amino acid adenylation domain-containing protein
VDLPLRVLFEHPVLSEIAAWLDRQQRSGTLPPPLEVQPEGTPLVMSYAQQRLWFLAQLEGPSATYNMPAILKLTGKLNIEALRQTFITLVERHQSLRLCFPDVGGEVTIQEVFVYDPLTITDLSQLPEMEQQQELQRLAQNHATQAFNLIKGQLLQLHLLIIDDCEQMLLFNMHHIISDGWSIDVLIREWVAIYSALLQGQTPNLVPLSIQYSDYAAWQRNWLQGEVLQRQLNYWTNQLSELPELLELPTDFSRPAVQSYRGTHLLSDINPKMTQQLKILSQQQGCTLFMTLLAAFNVLLYRYSGQEDILIGSPIAGRTHSQTENLIGFFANTLVLRTQIPNRITFTDLLKQVRKTALSAYAHQDIPFEHLVEHLNPERSLSYSPLFQVMFVLQNNEESELSLPELTIQPVIQETPIAKFDLTLNVSETDNYLTLVWEYATDLFQVDTIQRMAEHFAILLESITQNPESDIHLLPLLTEAETQQLIKWQGTETHYPKDKTIVDLFEEQVEKNPNHIALVFGEQQLNYQELNQLANQLAYSLITLNVQANTMVGLCVERSLEMVVGLLGILKANGAYVPLDPEYPQERLRFMLEDSQVSVLLTQSHMQARLPKLQAKILCLDDIEIFQHQSTDNLKLRCRTDDLAYVIYTSGSTGRPKGVCVPHHAVVRLVKNTDYAVFNSEQIFLQYAPSSFDAATLEIWGALLHSAKLVVMPAQRKSLEELAKILKLENISVLWLTSSLFNVMLEEHPDSLRGVKQLLTGGEALSVPHIHKALRQLPDTQLINGYGPTENTTFTCCYPISDQNYSNSIPIGKPIANTQVFIVDKNHQPLPVGGVGELVTSGAGLARGYLNRPSLTAEKFIEVDIFGKRERIYKTGDLARWLPDGNLEYLGRIDHQIKLRGFRIELGEIEAVLSQHDATNEVVVTLYERDGNKFLAAYLTLHQIIKPQILRDYLKAGLPDYMIPTSFTVLDKMPLTPNGKIDRRALPEPDAFESSENIVPRTETESLLTTLWSAVLKVEVNSVNAHFFDLGGHSLMATQLVSRIRDSFAIDMPLRVLFEHPVLSEMANWLDQQQRGHSLPPIMPMSEDLPLVMSYAQQRLWFIAQLEGHSATYNIPVALKLTGELDSEVLRQTFITLVERHLSLRLCFPEVNGEATVEEIPVYDPLTISDLTRLSETEQQTEVQNMAQIHATQLFDLAKGQLLQLHLLILNDHEQVLLFNMHHIISDGWSMGVLIRDWVQIYNALSQKQSPNLEPLPIQYPDYAIWQRNWLQGKVLQRQLDYWSHQLANAPELLELPTDFPRPAMQSYCGAHWLSNISPKLTQQIKNISQQQGCTLFMTLLAVFCTLIYRYSGQDDILIGSPIASRTQSQTENIIGFFVNTLVLRTHIENKTTFADLLKQIRQIALSAYAHQDIPFEHLVENLNPERSLSYSPLFQVMFTLQNHEESEINLPELSIQTLEQESTIAKFDLTLNVSDTSDHLALSWEYATDLFKANTIQRMAEHFAILLEGIVQNTEADIHILQLLTKTEIQQLIEWNHTKTDYPNNKTIMALFEEQVERHPNHIAVDFEGQQLSYQVLNQQANQIAHVLISLGVQADTLVGICVERSLDMVAGLLGILKSGGAYVPLDSNYPLERLRFMLEDSQVPVLVTQSWLQARLPDLTAKVIYLDDKMRFDNQPTNNPEHRSETENLAYVLFTSGSTGRPKGVMIEHLSAIALLSWSTDAFDTVRFQGTLASTSINFDLSVYELFVPLCSGGKVILAENALHLPNLLHKGRYNTHQYRSFSNRRIDKNKGNS